MSESEFEETGNNVAQIASLAVAASHAGRSMAPSRKDTTIIVQQGLQAVVIEGDACPDRIARKVKVLRAQDFIEYVSRCIQPGETSEVRAELSSVPDLMKILALLDPPDLHYATPSWETHKVELTLQNDTIFEQWMTFCSAKKSQEEVALFLEERFSDVVVQQSEGGAPSPSGLEMKQIAREFRVSRLKVFGKAIDMGTGEVEFEFSNKDSPGDKTSVTFPDYIYLGLPLLKGGARYVIKIRTRYLLDDTKLVLFFEIVDLDLLMEDAFGDVEAEIVAALVPDHALPVVRLAALPDRWYDALTV